MIKNILQKKKFIAENVSQLENMLSKYINEKIYQFNRMNESLKSRKSITVTKFKTNQWSLIEELCTVEMTFDNID